MVNDSVAARVLAVVVLCALLASCGGGGSAKPSPSSQGFIPAPAQSATKSALSTVTAVTGSPSPSAAASAPTPTPVATPDMQASAQANGCSVTPMTMTVPTAFQEGGYISKGYGKGDFWLAPAILPPNADIGSQRLPGLEMWFQGTTPITYEATGTPKLTGHLKNDPATTLSVVSLPPPPPTNIPPGHKVGQLGVTIPKPGCWQLSLASGSQTLNLTLWALPITQRPDVVNLANARKSMTAYPVPATCQATQWSGPADRGGPFIADYWITGQGMSVDTYVPVFFATVSATVMVYGNFPNQPTVSGQLAGNAIGAVRSSWIEHSGEVRSGWRGTLLFSNPGCWKVSVTDGSAKVDATIYVYPADCAPTGNSNNARPCKPPA